MDLLGVRRRQVRTGHSRAGPSLCCACPARLQLKAAPPGPSSETRRCSTMKPAGALLLVALLSLWAQLPPACGGDRGSAGPTKDGYCYRLPPLGGVFDGDNCSACQNKSCSTCSKDTDCLGAAKCCPDECGYACQEAVTDLCHLPSVCGFCKARFPRFFYNWSSQSCEVFVYGGCGGNQNNFETEEECQAACQPPGTA